MNKLFKKVISLGLALTSFGVLLTGCTEKKMHSEPKKITDYLYEITYDDYLYDSDYVTTEFDGSFGCSSVRNGNYYGRNYDFIFNDVPEFVVKVNAKEGRHASIGIASNFNLREGEMTNYDKELDFIPNLTLDGINDAGVICSHNVVHIDEKNKAYVTGTNPGAEDLHMLFIPRFVLDNASSADEAVELIKSRNIIGELADTFYLHIMIADANKTYVVEFYDNEVIVKQKHGNEQIMTNFYLNLEELPDNVVGLERYHILQNNYDLGSTYEGMQQLLKLVKYSINYDPDIENPWYSEYLSQSDMEGMDRAEFLERASEINNKHKILVENNIRDVNNSNYWITTHNSTYDMANKTLRLYVQEDYDKYYEYKLD